MTLVEVEIAELEDGSVVVRLELSDGTVFEAAREGLSLGSREVTWSTLAREFQTSKPPVRAARA